MELIIALAIGVLVGSGVWLLLRPRTYQEVIGISLKDRSAILPAGHAADGAYFLRGGRFVTSTYYRPDQITDLRAQKVAMLRSLLK